METLSLPSPRKALLPFATAGCNIVNLRTRASGSSSFATLDVRVPGDWSVNRSHTVADDIEQALLALGVNAATHIEPHADIE